MTTQTKTLLDFADILGLEMDCGCGATVSHPLEGWKQLPFRCPNCGATLLEREGTDAVQLESFVAYLKMAQRLALPNRRLRLHIQNPALLS